MSYSNTDSVPSGQAADPYVANSKQEPSLQEKVQTLANFADRCKFCLMTTNSPDGQLASRCMALAAREDNGVDFLFHANSESGKTDDLQKDSHVNLGFLNNSGEWASISGTAEIISDREKVRQYYTPTLKLWLGDLGDGKHDGGPEDPRIVVIKVKSKTAAFEVNPAGGLVASMIEVAKSAVTGEAAAPKKLEYLSAEELDKARAGGS